MFEGKTTVRNKKSNETRFPHKIDWTACIKLSEEERRQSIDNQVAQLRNTMRLSDLHGTQGEKIRQEGTDSLLQAMALISIFFCMAYQLHEKKVLTTWKVINEEERKSKALGEHMPWFGDVKGQPQGRIRLKMDVVRNALSYISSFMRVKKEDAVENDDNVFFEAASQYLFVLLTTFAHELYHQRQLVHNQQFWKKTSQIRSVDDNDDLTTEYLRSEGEAGANATTIRGLREIEKLLHSQQVIDKEAQALIMEGIHNMNVDIQYGNVKQLLPRLSLKRDKR